MPRSPRTVSASPSSGSGFSQGDTDLIATGTGTFGSRSTVVGGGALVKACDETIARRSTWRRGELEVSRADVEWRDGAARVIGAADRSLDLARLAALAGPEAPLEASVIFESPLNGPTSSGAYLAFVSVERETGRLTIERFVVVEDCGVVVNPLLVLGQQHGALAQGLGEALSERLVYDDRRPGPEFVAARLRAANRHEHSRLDIRPHRDAIRRSTRSA